MLVEETLENITVEVDEITEDITVIVSTNTGGGSGSDGLSAYEVAVANGFVGSESDWLLSLEGTDGLDGADGLNGTNGTNGLDGSDGVDGLSAYEIAVNNGFSGTEAEWLDSLQGEDGSSAEVVLQVFTPTKKSDKKYVTTGANKYTQTGVINFIGDLTGAIYELGGEDIIISNGDEWIFDGNFDYFSADIDVTDNVLTPEAGVTYRVITYFDGFKIAVVVGAITANNVLVALNAPSITATDNTVEAQITITIQDNNTSPNESSRQVEYKTTASGTWLTPISIAQDVTTYTFTGLAALTSYDFRVKDIGAVGIASDSPYSTTVSATTIASSSSALFFDDFNDGSINMSKWTVISGAGTTTEASNVVTLASTGSTGTAGIFGLRTTSNFSSANDLFIAQFKFLLADNTNALRIGISSSPYVFNNSVSFLQASSAAHTNIRCQVKDAGTNEVNVNTAVSAASLINARIKYIPSTGAVSFEYWNGSAWTSFGTAGNVNLGTNITLYIEGVPNVSLSSIGSVDHVWITDTNYTTINPL